MGNGKMCIWEQVYRIFSATRFRRALDRFGHAHFRMLQFHREEGMALRQTSL